MKKFTFLLMLLGFGAVLSAQTYNVTFKVNMNEVAGPFTTPEVNGNFNGWCGGCAPMTDPDLDGIWEVTIALTAGTYEYKFAYDSWTGQENLIPGTPCTVTNFGFTNRSLVVTGDAVLATVCWGSCDNCGVGELYDITFQVNMNDVAAPFTTPEVNGNFNGWCGGCAPMTDANGDGIWTITITLAPGTYEYKFAYDAWTGQEALTEGSPCTVTNFGFTNRSLVVTGNAVLNPVCWASCSGCSTTYYADADGDSYGNAASFITSTAFTAPAGYTVNATDCNDANASIRPGATEICNGIDDNCDALIDNGVINSTVSASGPTSFCSGSNVVLSVAAGYTSYQWKKNGANIPGASTASYIVTQGGNYSVYIASGACNTTSAITAVVVSRPKPKVTPVGSLDICLTGSVLLKGKVGIGSTYEWFKNGVLIVGAPLNYVATSVGSYKFKETTTLGCTKSVTTVVTSSCKIGDEANTNISLYPNPASESVTINFNANSNEISKIGVAIYAITGEVIYNEMLSLNNGIINETISFDKGIASGVYLVKIDDGVNTSVKTLVIE